MDYLCTNQFDSKFFFVVVCKWYMCPLLSNLVVYIYINPLWKFASRGGMGDSVWEEVLEIANWYIYVCVWQRCPLLFPLANADGASLWFFVCSLMTWCVFYMCLLEIWLYGLLSGLNRLSSTWFFLLVFREVRNSFQHFLPVRHLSHRKTCRNG